MEQLTEQEVMDKIEEKRRFLRSREAPYPKESKGKRLASWGNRIYQWVEIEDKRYLYSIFTLYYADTKEEAVKIIKAIDEETHYLRELEVASWKHQSFSSPDGD